MSNETARRELLEESTVPVTPMDGPLNGRVTGHVVDLNLLLGYGANPPRIHFIEVPRETGVIAPLSAVGGHEFGHDLHGGTSSRVPVLPDMHAPVSAEVRRQQLAALAAFTKQPGSPVITFGDFNDDFARCPASGERGTPVTEDLVLQHGQRRDQHNNCSPVPLMTDGELPMRPFSDHGLTLLRLDEVVMSAGRRAKLDALLAKLHVDNSGPITEGQPDTEGNEHYHQPTDHLPMLCLVQDEQPLFDPLVYQRGHAALNEMLATTTPSAAPGEGEKDS